MNKQCKTCNTQLDDNDCSEYCAECRLDMLAESSEVFDYSEYPLISQDIQQ